MKKTFGGTFRELRENRGVSLSSLADETVTKGAISRFENDHSDLSASRLFHLLEKLNISPSEFLFAANGYKGSSTSVLLRRTTNAVIQNKPSELQRIALEELNKWENKKDLFGKLNYLMIQCIIASDNGCDKELANELGIVTDYLFRCNDWGQYEIILFGNTLSQLPIETIAMFAQDLPKKLALFNRYGLFYEASINVLLNVLALLIKHKCLSTAYKTLHYLRTNDFNEAYLLEHTLLLFYEGVLESVDEKKEEGKRKINNALTVFELTNSDFFYENCIRFLKEDMRFSVD